MSRTPLTPPVGTAGTGYASDLDTIVDRLRDSVADIRDWGAVPGDDTDHLSAFNQAVTDLPTRGGYLKIPKGEFLFSDKWVVNKPLALEGSGVGTFRSNSPSVLKFAAGKGGVEYAANVVQGGEVRRLCLYSLSAGAGAGRASAEAGLKVLNHGVLLEHVLVDSFGGDGVWVPGNTPENTNNTAGSHLRSINNGGNGYLLLGGLNGGNVQPWYNCDAANNAGIGVERTGHVGLWIGGQCASNRGSYAGSSATVANVDFLDNASGSRWVDIYSEGAHAFVFGTNAHNPRVDYDRGFGFPTFYDYTGLVVSPPTPATSQRFQSDSLSWSAIAPHSIATQNVTLPFKFSTSAFSGVINTFTTIIGEPSVYPGGAFVFYVRAIADGAQIVMANISDSTATPAAGAWVFTGIRSW